MKNLLTVFLAFSITGVMHAQYVKNQSVGIYYNLLMLENELTKDIEYEYRPGSAYSFTKLYPPEMMMISSAFLQHVKSTGSVKNYVGPLGTTPPTSMGDRGFEEAIRKIDNGKLERIGRMYFETSQYEDYVTHRNDTFYLGEDAIVTEDLLLSPPDTIYTENLQSGVMEQVVVQVDESYSEYASGIGFIEEWSYDHKKSSLNKEIKYMMLTKTYLDPLDDSYRGQQSLFTFKSGKFNKKNINSEQLVQEDVEYNVLFNRDFTQMDEEINYSGMARSSDANGYIEPSDRMQFIISILHNVKNGQLNIYEYDPLTFDPDKLVKVHNIAWFEGIKSTDTAIFEDIATGEMKEVTVSLELKLQDVVGIRFFEDWYLDADNINMYKRVNGIVFLKEVIDAETGELKGVAPISPFYIKLNPGM